MNTEEAANPTSFLPPLLRLSSTSTQDISHAFRKLRDLYWPPTLPTLPASTALPERTIPKLIHEDTIPDSGYASAEEDLEDEVYENVVHVTSDTQDSNHLEALRADVFQREFAIKWLTGFIARSGPWIELAVGIDDYEARSCLLDDATVILSGFVGAKDEGYEEDDQALARQFTFLTPSGDQIAVELRDAPLLEDDHTSVGLQSWSSCIYLGERLCATPELFSLSPSVYFQRSLPLRVLELGAGTGMLSIIAAKLLSGLSPPPMIIATDYHPDVLVNLSMNIETNLAVKDTASPPVSVHKLDWEKPLYEPPLDIPFDIVLAADVVYHPDHARQIKGCVERVLKRPDAIDRNGGVFWMIIALRPVGRHKGLDESVVRMFPEGSVAHSGPRLAILDDIDIDRSKGVGRADESGYKLFKIGWKI